MKELEKLCETMVLPVVSIIVCSHLCLWKDIISLEKILTNLVEYSCVCGPKSFDRLNNDD